MANSKQNDEKLVTFIGNGIIWDAVNDKPLCEFKNGKFTTDNPDIIEMLTKKGFKQG